MELKTFKLAVQKLLLPHCSTSTELVKEASIVRMMSISTRLRLSLINIYFIVFFIPRNSTQKYRYEIIIVIYYKMIFKYNRLIIDATNTAFSTFNEMFTA